MKTMNKNDIRYQAYIERGFRRLVAVWSVPCLSFWNWCGQIVYVEIVVIDNI